MGQIHIYGKYRDCVYDYENGVVVDPGSGEVIDSIYVADPSDGFRARVSNDPYKSIHYSVVIDRRVPKHIYKAIHPSLENAAALLRQIFNGIDIDFNYLLNIVYNAYRASIDAGAGRHKRDVVAAAAVYIYSLTKFSRYVDPYKICLDVGGSAAVCRAVRRVVIKLSKIYKFDRVKVIANLIDSISDDPTSSYIAKLLLRYARISGVPGKVVAGALMYIATYIRGGYITLREIAKNVDVHEAIISRYISSNNVAKIFRSRAGAVTRIEIPNKICIEVEKVLKPSNIVVCI